MSTVSYKLTETFMHLVSNQRNKPDITIVQRQPNSFVKRFLGSKNTYIEIKGNSHNKIDINYDKTLKRIEKALTRSIADDKWKQQESDVYIPALINKELDIAASLSGKSISTEQKDNIRSATLQKVNLTNQFNDPQTLKTAAQTSIGQTTTTHLLKDSALSTFFKNGNYPRELQSEITASISNKISDALYERIMGQHIRNIRRIVQLEARKELNPAKKVCIDLSKIS